MTTYEQDALDFLENSGTKMTIKKDCVIDRFPGEDAYTGNRWRYRVTMKRNGKQYSFNFHDSIYNYNKGLEPRPYDVLACLQNSEPEHDTWDFADEFGYDIDGRAAFNRVDKIRKACEREYKALLRLYDGEIPEELQEIC